jgi:hypothetical protein
MIKRRLKKIAKKNGCHRLCLTTTNDNVEGLSFYQKPNRGFVIKGIRKKIIKEYKIKPQIPLIGASGIPVRDEIELESILL